MATFRIALSNPGRKNEDGTLSVSIRLLHRRKQVFIPTPFRVFPSRVRKGEVADHHVVSSLTSRILWMQEETARLGLFQLPADVVDVGVYLQHLHVQLP